MTQCPNKVDVHIRETAIILMRERSDEKVVRGKERKEERKEESEKSDLVVMSHLSRGGQ